VVRESEEDKRAERRLFIDSFELGGWIDASRVVESILSTID
jgi:hypothetical protein